MQHLVVLSALPPLNQTAFHLVWSMVVAVSPRQVGKLEKFPAPKSTSTVWALPGVLLNFAIHSESLGSCSTELSPRVCLSYRSACPQHRHQKPCATVMESQTSSGLPLQVILD